MTMQNFPVNVFKICKIIPPPNRKQNLKSFVFPLSDESNLYEKQKNI